MSYADQNRRARSASLAAVAFIHVAIGYAFVSGLAMRVIPHIPLITRAEILHDPLPPPPHDLPPPARREPVVRQASQPEIIVPLRTDLLPLLGQGPVALPSVEKQPGTLPLAQPAQPPRASLARDAGPVGNHAAWVTSDDYPARALREGAAGVVGIAVLVGTDGRVASCAVTASSGNADLDDATCRTYSRRARFRPALDADGNPVASHHADRIRWQMPE